MEDVIADLVKDNTPCAQLHITTSVAYAQSLQDKTALMWSSIRKSNGRVVFHSRAPELNSVVYVSQLNVEHSCIHEQSGPSQRINACNYNWNGSNHIPEVGQTPIPEKGATESETT